MQIAYRKCSIVLGLALMLTHCSSGGSGGSIPNPPGPTGTPVTVTFLAQNPSAVAVAIGASSTFTPLTLAGNAVSFSVPAGTTTYALAVACQPVVLMGTLIVEQVIEATISDGTSFTVDPCYSTPTLATATGAFDVSAVAGATQARILGSKGYGTTVNATSGAFSASMSTGTNDVAVIAEDASNNVLAVKFVRAQTVPGVINGGATIALSAADAVTLMPVTITGIPAGYSPTPALNSSYISVGGTYIDLGGNSTTQYPALAAADAATGDSYQINTNDSDLPSNGLIGTSTNSTSATAVTLTYPSGWSYAGPAAAHFPTLAFAYSGFSGMAKVVDYAQISWQINPTTYDSIAVYATAAYLGSATTVTIPDLSSLSGFFSTAISGTTIYWLGQIDGGTYLGYTSAPAVGNLSYVQVRGTYVQP